jgi:hypothetical protein
MKQNGNRAQAMEIGGAAQVWRNEQLTAEKKRAGFALDLGRVGK